MHRFLIFLLLFPAVATAAFYAVTSILTGAAQDGGWGPVLMYLVFMVPGLVVALIDGLVGKSSVPVVLATTVLSYGLFVLALALLMGTGKNIVALGLIGAIPAAICSWLSNRRM